MTIEDAIQHCKDEAHVLFQHSAKHRTGTEDSCYECAKEHEQLAEWLTELKQRREAEITAPPKSNGDRIRQMTDDEELLSAIGTGCYRCVYNNGECDSGYGEGCISGNLEWLRKEANENAETD